MAELKNQQNRTKLCFVVSSPMTASAFLNGHIDYLTKAFDVTVICNFDGTEKNISKNAKLKNINIARRISPLADLSAMWNLYRFQRTEKFVIVHSVTPKAGLLTSISSWLARTPIRIHWFTGQVWVLSNGIKRSTLKNLDRLIAILDTHLLVDSPSQQEFLINQRVIGCRKSSVLGNGSIAGVDTSRFRPNALVRQKNRSNLGVNDPEQKVIIYLGRLCHDKGLDTLLNVFTNGSLIGDPYLLLVGPDEENYASKFKNALQSKMSRFGYVPYTTEPENYLATADIYCLPSFREGFGLSIIEASSVGLPVVASRIYGVTDSVSDEETGFLVSPGDVQGFEKALNRLLTSPIESKKMGLTGRKRAIEFWQSNILESELADLYCAQLQNLGYARHDT
jgi:glycosyltransferase involved in cell wall biosynthesis